MYSILKKTKDHYLDKRSVSYRLIFTAALLFAFHYYLIAYVNSTFLGEITDTRFIGIFYALSAIINVIIFLRAPSTIKKYGGFKFIVAFTCLEILTLIALATVKIPVILIISFIIHHSINPIILACLDMYLEDHSEKKNMGATRGAFLTIIAIAAIISPLAIGSLVEKADFSKIYLLSVFFMSLFLLWIIKNFRTMDSGRFKEIKVTSEIKEFLKNKKIRNITFCHSLLQFFYSWMIIYVPLYLVREAGFEWGQSSIIISISLLPFLLFEIPVGQMADRHLDERELIMTGFFLAGTAVFLFPFISYGTFILWAIILFIARTGASLIETASESYFFRSIQGKDELIEIFRIAGPAAFVAGPLTGSFLLEIFSFSTIFFVLSAVMFFGIYIASRMKKESI